MTIDESEYDEVCQRERKKKGDNEWSNLQEGYCKADYDSWGADTDSDAPKVTILRD